MLTPKRRTEKDPSDPRRDPIAAFFHHVPATVWVTDEHLVLQFVEGAFMRTLDVDTASLIGRKLSDLVLDFREDHPLIQGHLTALAGRENSVRIEWGGNLYYARIAPIRNAQGEITGCAGVYQQIGWLPDDEGMLREPEIRLRRVTDLNIVGIAFGDGDGRITDANEAFLEISGCTHEDLTTDYVSWPALTPVEHHQRYLRALEEIAETGRCAPFEQDVIRKDGRRIPVLVGGARLSATRREGVAFVLDLSERKRAERALRAELTCADLLLDARSVTDVADALLAALCSELGWAGASLWLTQGDGELVRAASHGEAGGGSQPFAVPLMAGTRRLGTLNLVHAEAEPGAGAVSSSLAIAARVARFLQKS